MDVPKTVELRETLLIVEDDMLIAMSLQYALEDAGYRVLDLTDRPQEAVSAALELQPDLALVNIDLGGRDDGIELAQELKKIGVPSLFISGQVNRARSAHTAAVGSLPKPYSPSDMVIAVAYLLAHLRGDESHPRPSGLEVFGEAPGEVVPEPV